MFSCSIMNETGGHLNRFALFLLFYSIVAVIGQGTDADENIEADHHKGCVYLHCEGSDQCVHRKFRCKNPPCPTMLYCSKSRTESLRGPSTCDTVRCSRGHVCIVKVRGCRWDEKCKQQIARCISRKEYYEGPASCAGFKCPAGNHCVLRESLCVNPPCKLLRSCARNKDVQVWFGRCRSLGCPSEFECFLRRPDNNCEKPPCRHMPDCITTTENEVSNEHCRGWICPRSQTCSAQIVEPCETDNCDVERSCQKPIKSSINHSSTVDDERVEKTKPPAMAPSFFQNFDHRQTNLTRKNEHERKSRTQTENWNFRDFSNASDLSFDRNERPWRFLRPDRREEPYRGTEKSRLEKDREINLPNFSEIDNSSILRLLTALQQYNHDLWIQKLFPHLPQRTGNNWNRSSNEFNVGPQTGRKNDETFRYFLPKSQSGGSVQIDPDRQRLQQLLRIHRNDARPLPAIIDAPNFKNNDRPRAQVEVNDERSVGKINLVSLLQRESENLAKARKDKSLINEQNDQGIPSRSILSPPYDALQLAFLESLRASKHPPFLNYDSDYPTNGGPTIVPPYAVSRIQNAYEDPSFLLPVVNEEFSRGDRLVKNDRRDFENYESVPAIPENDWNIFGQGHRYEDLTGPESFTKTADKLYTSNERPRGFIENSKEHIDSVINLSGKVQDSRQDPSVDANPLTALNKNTDDYPEVIDLKSLIEMNKNILPYIKTLMEAISQDYEELATNKELNMDDSALKRSIASHNDFLSNLQNSEMQESSRKHTFENIQTNVSSNHRESTVSPNGQSHQQENDRRILRLIYQDAQPLIRSFYLPGYGAHKDINQESNVAGENSEPFRNQNAGVAEDDGKLKGGAVESATNYPN